MPNYLNTGKTNVLDTLTVQGALEAKAGVTAVSAIVKAMPSQTADLQQWQDSAGAVLSRVAPDGSVQFGASLSRGSVKHVLSPTGTGWLGVYNPDTSKHYGIATTLPAPPGTSVLGGYYQGLGVGGQSHNAGQPIFGVATQSVSDATAAPFVVWDNGAAAHRSLTASAIGLIVKGAASQTADLQQWQDSAGAVKARVISSGNLAVNHGGSSDVAVVLNGGAGASRGLFLTGFTGQQIDAVGFSVSSTGRVEPRAGLASYSTAASMVPLHVIGAAGQTADLQQWLISDGGNVGAKMTAAGNLDFMATGRGPILVSPNGTRYRVTVDDAGVLSSVAA